MSETPAKIVTRSIDKSLREIRYVGVVTHQIVGSKLPSNQQVLQLLLFYVRFNKCKQREAAIMVAREVMLFWAKARIPTIVDHRVDDHVQKLYEKWRTILKCAHKKTVTQTQNMENWSLSMDNSSSVWTTPQ